MTMFPHALESIYGMYFPEDMSYADLMRKQVRVFNRCILAACVEQSVVTIPYNGNLVDVSLANVDAVTKISQLCHQLRCGIAHGRKTPLHRQQSSLSNFSKDDFQSPEELAAVKALAERIEAIARSRGQAAGAEEPILLSFEDFVTIQDIHVEIATVCKAHFTRTFRQY